MSMLDCFLCARHCAGCSPCIFSHLMLQPGVMVEYPVLSDSVQLPYSDAISRKARLTRINLPCRNYILLDINQWAKLSSVFPAWNRWKGRGRKILALGWNRSGQGRFHTHQVERHKELLWGWGPSASSPEQGLWEPSGWGAADLRHMPRGAEGCFRLGWTGWSKRVGEAVPPPSAPGPVLQLALAWGSGREAKININSPERVQDRILGYCRFKACSATGLLWDLGKG